MFWARKISVLTALDRYLLVTKIDIHDTTEPLSAPEPSSRPNVEPITYSPYHQAGKKEGQFCHWGIGSVGLVLGIKPGVFTHSEKWPSPRL